MALLGPGNAFERLEYYDYSPISNSWEADWFCPTPRALDLINILCPFLSTVTIRSGIKALDHHKYCACPVQRSNPTWNVICALSRFHNLQHIALYVEIDEFRITLIDHTSGRDAVAKTFNFIQQQKCGLPVSRLRLTFTTFASNLFGSVDTAKLNRQRISMTCEYSEAHESDEKDSTTCTDASFTKILQHRKRAAERGRLRAWERHVGPYLWKKRQGKQVFPTFRQLVCIIRLALPRKLCALNRHRNQPPELMGDETVHERSWRFAARCWWPHNIDWLVDRSIDTSFVEDWIYSNDIQAWEVREPGIQGSSTKVYIPIISSVLMNVYSPWIPPPILRGCNWWTRPQAPYYYTHPQPKIIKSVSSPFQIGSFEDTDGLFFPSLELPLLSDSFLRHVSSFWRGIRSKSTIPHNLSYLSRKFRLLCYVT